MTYNLVDQMNRGDLRRALKRADLVIFDEVLRFLEDDSRTFGTGYLKEDIWRYIRRYPLDETHIARLENAALNYVYRPMSREFKEMCCAMTWIATPDFWTRVAERLVSEVPLVQLNAWCLHGYAGGLMAGEVRRRDCYRFTHYDISTKWRYSFCGWYTPKELMRLLHEPEYWPQGNVLQRSASWHDLPIVYYVARGEYGIDKEFARLNIKAANADLLLPKFEEILLEEPRSPSTDTTWLYIIYLMHQMDDTRVVPILIKFLDARVNYKFESETKFLLLNSVLKVLRYYATPEALAVVASQHKDYQGYWDHLAGRIHGWMLSISSHFVRGDDPSD